MGFNELDLVNCVFGVELVDARDARLVFAAIDHGDVEDRMSDLARQLDVVAIDDDLHPLALREETVVEDELLALGIQLAGAKAGKDFIAFDPACSSDPVIRADYGRCGTGALSQRRLFNADAPHERIANLWLLLGAFDAG